MLSWLKSNDLLQRRPWLFIGIALVARGLYAWLAIGQLGPDKNPGWLYVESGDAALYLDPIDNLIANGKYFDDYRMPGVGAPYYLLRQFLGPQGSRQAVVLLQWLLSGFTAYLLGKVAWRLTGRHAIGLAVYAVYLLSAYSAWYDPVIASDSFSSSILIAHAWLLHRAVETRRRGTLLLAGLCIAWLVFLRPIAVLLLPVSAFVAWWFWERSARWGMALVMLLPFLVFDSIWIARNWHVNHRFRPLTNQGYQPDYFMKEIRAHAMVFVQGYGGDYIWWNPGSDIRWFGIWKGGAELDDEGLRAKEPPPYAYVEGYNRDSLQWLADRTRYIAVADLPEADSLRAVEEVNAKFDRYAALYREKAPVQFQVMSRLRMFRNVMLQNGTETIILKPFAALPVGWKLFKLAQAALFALAYGLLWIAVPVLIWQWRKELTPLRVFVPLAAIYLTMVFPLGLRMCEWRYLAMQFPLVLMLSICFVMHLMPWKRRATPSA